MRISDCILTVLDWETYYDKEYSLSKMTTEAYIRDPRFEAIMVSIAFGNEPTRIITGTHEEIRQQLLQYPWHKIYMGAHNNSFDAAVLHYRFGITPRYLFCTQRLAAPYYGHTHSLSLASLAEALGLPAKGTAVHDMLGKHRLDLTPQEFREYAEYCKHDNWLCRQLFLKFVRMVPEHELYTLSSSLMMFARPKLVLDQPVLLDALRDEAYKRTTILSDIATQLGPLGHIRPATVRSILSSADKFTQLLEALGVDVPYKAGKKGLIPAIAKTDPGFEELLHAPDPFIRTLCEARLLIKSTQAESRAQRLFEISQRGTMPFPVHWCGALAAHRWAAWDSINTQNMQRGGFLRRSIVAPRGYKLVVADLSQIELRVGWWLAGEWDNLNRFAHGGHDPYRQIMTDAFGIPYESIDKGSVIRQTGKVICLSGIYQTGAKKSRHTVRVQAGKTISMNEAQLLIDTYRSKNQCVVKAWKSGEQALEAMYAGQLTKVWKDSILAVKNSLLKPDGLPMVYPELTPHVGQWQDGSPKREWTYRRRKGKVMVTDHLYGGKLFQNATQSLSRDIMSRIIARWTQELPEECFIVGTVHDEGIILAPDALAEQIQAYVEASMVVAPPWATDLPLAAEVSVGTCYGQMK